MFEFYLHNPNLSQLNLNSMYFNLRQDPQTGISWRGVKLNPTNKNCRLLKAPVYLPVRLSDAPHIDPYYGKNQTVQLGQTVSLDCKIYNVANR